MTGKINEKAQKASLELSPYELEFANQYLNRTKTGLSNAQCVLRAYPGHNSEKGATVTAHRLLHTPRVLNYLCAMGAEALETIGESFNSCVDYWHTCSMSARELLRPFCTTIEVSPGPCNEFISIRLWVEHIRDIPDQYQAYVEGYIPSTDGGYIVVEKEIYGAKERNVARLQLDKMVGNTIDRIELSGTVTNVTAKLPEDASVEDISQLYMKLLRGRENR